MLSKRNDLYYAGFTPEERLKLNVTRSENTERYEKGIYQEAARRVVFRNCLNAHPLYLVFFKCLF